MAGTPTEAPSTIAAAFLELCVLARNLARRDHTDPRVATLHGAATILEEEYPAHFTGKPAPQEPDLNPSDPYPGPPPHRLLSPTAKSVFASPLSFQIIPAAYTGKSAPQEPDDDAEWLRCLADTWVRPNTYHVFGGTSDEAADRIIRIANRLQAKAPETGE